MGDETSTSARKAMRFMSKYEKVKLKHGTVRLEDKTDIDCTIVGKDIFTGAEERIKNVPWQGLYDWLINGDYIQDALSSVSVDGRDFLLTGIGAKSYSKLFPTE